MIIIISVLSTCERIVYFSFSIRNQLENVFFATHTITVAKKQQNIKGEKSMFHLMDKCDDRIK